MEDGGPWVSTEVAAVFLRISKTSVQRRYDDGELKGYRTGVGKGSRRIWVSSLITAYKERYGNDPSVEQVQALKGESAPPDLTIRVHKQDGSMSAAIDEIPRAHATGDTLEEIGAGLDEAIDLINREE